ncbi:hypothetical protein JL09_g123 [Pichia kudriavzevii]|uniref:Uncharacterized protein n=1 Tax=Pichia kudriavzevii TaxID=4909 RepID=A0A099P8T0_PICKU|nr:hypothetical protein JL09_g123 [Pichia kudriavzevii]
MSKGFSNQIKESNMNVVLLDGAQHMITCTLLEYLDKIIINMAVDGEIDISYDIQVPELNVIEKPVRKYDYDFEDEEEETRDDRIPVKEEECLNSTIIPTVLIGAGHTLKNQVLASQIGHMMAQHTNKNIILNVSGKLFGKPSAQSEYHEKDSELLTMAKHLIAQTYLV